MYDKRLNACPAARATVNKREKIESDEKSKKKKKEKITKKKIKTERNKTRPGDFMGHQITPPPHKMLKRRAFVQDSLAYRTLSLADVHLLLLLLEADASPAVRELVSCVC